MRFLAHIEHASLVLLLDLARYSPSAEIREAAIVELAWRIAP